MKNSPSLQFKIGDKIVGHNHPTYFIADIAANHDGDLDRAQKLIHLAAESGADGVKFQHFSAKTIVSDYGFRSMGNQQSHQETWKKSVFEVYQDASLDLKWTPVLKETCEKAGIDFFTSPYSFDLVDEVDSSIPAFKIGSGDITWLGIIDYMAKKKKPIFLACGASTMDEVYRAVNTILKYTTNVVLMQCNTNYTASLDNFNYINLNVLNTFKAMFPDVILGLSDHTPGLATVLGAIALGARAIEKHFTDDTTRQGPDHKFSMNPDSWKEMVGRSRELELAMGDGVKKIEENERETVILQRRCLRTTKDIPKGTLLTADHLEVLRPCPPDGLPPYMLEEIIGMSIIKSLKAGAHLTWSNLTQP